jgi:hypothetical protein
VRTGVAGPEPKERPNGQRSRSRPNAAAVAAVVLATLGLLGGGAVPPMARMTGLYNIVVAPFTAIGAAAQSLVPTEVQHVLTRELRDWSEGEAAVQLRGPQGIDLAADLDRRGALHAAAVSHGADVVIAGRVEPSGDGALTVTVELFLDVRIVEETPELAGVHEISVTEPADVLDRNPAINERLAQDARDHVAGVVAFVRGLGGYAVDDYAAAEEDFLTAAAELAASGRHIAGLETVHLLLGNTIGRGDPRRLAVAADHFRTALALNPSYPRARIGLAEVMRAGTSCAPGEADDTRLQRAAEDYRAALASAADTDGLDPALLELKARLGLGLAHQCRTIAGLGNHWADAETEFGRVLHLYEQEEAATVSSRQRLRLAAEARAGQALTALMTAEQPDAARYGGYPAAAQAYADALALLRQIDVVRPTNLRRELVLLRNLKVAHQRLGIATQITEIDDRIARVEGTLAALARPGRPVTPPASGGVTR